jgi:hypothetical protein
MTTVTYHRDGYGPARPAINVKDRHSGMDFVIALERLVGNAAVVLGESVNCRYPDDLRDIAYERVVSDFWQAAQEIATQRGLGTIYSEGRSGGWLVIDNDPTHGGEDDADPEWLAGYRALSEWADAYIADSPGKVARLTQSLAMDEAGEPAARRMFGTVTA